jgi:hypothetical protein
LPETYISGTPHQIVISVDGWTEKRSEGGECQSARCEFFSPSINDMTDGDDQSAAPVCLTISFPSFRLELAETGLFGSQLAKVV